MNEGRRTIGTMGRVRLRLLAMALAMLGDKANDKAAVRAQMADLRLRRPAKNRSRQWAGHREKALRARRAKNRVASESRRVNRAAR